MTAPKTPADPLLKQVGWQKRVKGRLVKPWPLTKFNAHSFDDNDGVWPVYECPGCEGRGYVT